MQQVPVLANLVPQRQLVVNTAVVLRSGQQRVVSTRLTSTARRAGAPPLPLRITPSSDAVTFRPRDSLLRHGGSPNLDVELENTTDYTLVLAQRSSGGSSAPEAMD